MNRADLAYRLGFGARRRAEVTQQYRQRYEGIAPPSGPRPEMRKAPLTSGQHILHLLLTIFTAGLWLPVWTIRAAQGNQYAVPPQPPPWTTQPPQAPPWPWPQAPGQVYQQQHPYPPQHPSPYPPQPPYPKSGPARG